MKLIKLLQSLLNSERVCTGYHPQPLDSSQSLHNCSLLLRYLFLHTYHHSSSDLLPCSNLSTSSNNFITNDNTHHDNDSPKFQILSQTEDHIQVRDTLHDMDDRHDGGDDGDDDGDDDGEDDGEDDGDGDDDDVDDDDGDDDDVDDGDGDDGEDKDGEDDGEDDENVNDGEDKCGEVDKNGESEDEDEGNEGNDKSNEKREQMKKRREGVAGELRCTAEDIIEGRVDHIIALLLLLRTKFDVDFLFWQLLHDEEHGSLGDLDQLPDFALLEDTSPLSFPPDRMNHVLIDDSDSSDDSSCNSHDYHDHCDDYDDYDDDYDDRDDQDDDDHDDDDHDDDQDDDSTDEETKEVEKEEMSNEEAINQVQLVALKEAEEIMMEQHALTLRLSSLSSSPSFSSSSSMRSSPFASTSPAALNSPPVINDQLEKELTNHDRALAISLGSQPKHPPRTLKRSDRSSNNTDWIKLLALKIDHQLRSRDLLPPSLPSFQSSLIHPLPSSDSPICDHQLNEQANNQSNDQVSDQPNNQLNDQSDNQADNQANDQVNNQVKDQSNEKMFDQVSGQLNEVRERREGMGGTWARVEVKERNESKRKEMVEQLQARQKLITHRASELHRILTTPSSSPAELLHLLHLYKSTFLSFSLSLCLFLLILPLIVDLFHLI